MTVANLIKLSGRMSCYMEKWFWYSNFGFKTGEEIGYGCYCNNREKLTKYSVFSYPIFLDLLNHEDLWYWINGKHQREPVEIVLWTKNNNSLNLLLKSVTKTFRYFLGMWFLELQPVAWMAPIRSFLKIAFDAVEG